MKNYKLTIQYEGTNYAGWQIQKNALTVQQAIADAIEVVLKEKINLIGAGRTDSGVHAIGQVANFKCEKKIDTDKICYSLNSILPNDISILKIENVADNFHSRFDAKKRSYIYLISKYKSPFLNKYSYLHRGNLDCEILNKISLAFLGKKDFSSFAKTGSDTKNNFCNVYSASWKETRGIIIFSIEADRFLRGMVRAITGTILLAAKEGYGEKYIESVFKKRDRKASGMAVPAKGLFLYKIKYG